MGNAGMTIGKTGNSLEKAIGSNSLTLVVMDTQYNL
jgi:hypothetical protein